MSKLSQSNFNCHASGKLCMMSQFQRLCDDNHDIMIPQHGAAAWSNAALLLRVMTEWPLTYDLRLFKLNTKETVPSCPQHFSDIVAKIELKFRLEGKKRTTLCLSNTHPVQRVDGVVSAWFFLRRTQHFMSDFWWGSAVQPSWKERRASYSRELAAERKM